MSELIPRAERYRPANGTEGDLFQSHWCAGCERDRDGDCPILAATMAYDIDDVAYPPEWIVGRDGPECTAYVAYGDQVPTPRCSRTPDMFGG